MNARCNGDTINTTLNVNELGNYFKLNTNKLALIIQGPVMYFPFLIHTGL